jgi:hypothetical protein
MYSATRERENKNKNEEKYEDNVLFSFHQRITEIIITTTKKKQTNLSRVEFYLLFFHMSIICVCV